MDSQLIQEIKIDVTHADTKNEIVIQFIGKKNKKLKEIKLHDVGSSIEISREFRRKPFISWEEHSSLWKEEIIFDDFKINCRGNLKGISNFLQNVIENYVITNKKINIFGIGKSNGKLIFFGTMVVMKIETTFVEQQMQEYIVLEFSGRKYYK